MSGRTLIGARAHFTAAHRGWEGELHTHAWNVEALFDAPAGVDARCQKASLDMLCQNWEGKPLPIEIESNEGIARAIATLINCVEVKVWRADGGDIGAVWKAAE